MGPFLTYDEIKQVVASGDLIEIQRSGYKHWVICESNDNDQGGTVWCFHVSSINSRAKHKVYDGTEGWDMCRVNNQEQEADKTGLIARPLDQVFEDLRTLVDQKVEYNLNLRNCEYYCTLWKYGIGWSQQVDMTELKVMAGIMGVAFGGLLSNRAAVVIPALTLMCSLVIPYYMYIECRPENISLHCITIILKQTSISSHQRWKVMK
ncbi:unnamed protein product [Oppiella nova]|uniref:LRAT domain-containing protein n=1 Tax=Oppiella nova TaxID=334625 RepID=A0A7R9L9H5_9ACAR|nr:unnamed protein product [Oppiella nova]CAG2160827.1 unnamed protein product [Oppiella nova]